MNATVFASPDAHAAILALLGLDHTKLIKTALKVYGVKSEAPFVSVALD